MLLVETSAWVAMVLREPGHEALVGAILSANEVGPRRASPRA